MTVFSADDASLYRGAIWSNNSLLDRKLKCDLTLPSAVKIASGYITGEASTLSRVTSFVRQFAGKNDYRLTTRPSGSRCRACCGSELRESASLGNQACSECQVWLGM